jgi:type I site-specific restriction-modification system R (restriction) subunit
MMNRCCTMYVDKMLSDIKAVQTLSRLNRATQERKIHFYWISPTILIRYKELLKPITPRQSSQMKQTPINYMI